MDNVKWFESRNRWLIATLLFVGAFFQVAKGDEQRTNRVIENPVQDGNLILRVNDGGVKTDVVTVEGATSLLKLRTLSNLETADALTITNLSGTQTAEYGAYGINGSAVGFKFQANNTQVGSYANAGGWTLGPSGFTGVHTILGDVIQVPANNDGVALEIRSSSNSSRMSLGVDSGGTTGVVSAVSSLAIITDNDNNTGGAQIQFGADASTAAGMTSLGYISENGQWSVGPAGYAGHHQVQGNLQFADGYLRHSVDAVTAGTYNNLNIGNVGLLDAQTAGGTITITGIAGGVQGRVLHIIKSSSANSLVINYADGSSSAVNRILNNAGANKTFTGYAHVILIHSGNFWYMANQ